LTEFPRWVRGVHKLGLRLENATGGVLGCRLKALGLLLTARGCLFKARLVSRATTIMATMISHALKDDERIADLIEGDIAEVIEEDIKELERRGFKAPRSYIGVFKTYWIERLKRLALEELTVNIDWYGFTFYELLKTLQKHNPSIDKKTLYRHILAELLLKELDFDPKERAFIYEPLVKKAYGAYLEILREVIESLMKRRKCFYGKTID